MFYAIMGTIVLALMGLVGGWIKGPNWSRTALIALFSALLVVAVVLTCLQSLHPDSTPTPSPTPTRITSSNEETATGQPQPTETPYTADEGATTGRPQPTDTPYTERRSIHATDLQVGDCYNKSPSAQVNDVEVVDCSIPHLFEVYNNYQIPRSTFPDKSTMESEQRTACYDDVFETYVGVPYERSRLGVTTLIPSEESWAEGDRTITCALVAEDSSRSTGSLRGAAK